MTRNVKVLRRVIRLGLSADVLLPLCEDLRLWHFPRNWPSSAKNGHFVISVIFHAFSLDIVKVFGLLSIR